MISTAALLIGVDTGLTHMGIALSVPTLALCLCLALPSTADEPETTNPVILAHAEEATTPEAALHLWFDAVFRSCQPLST